MAALRARPADFEKSYTAEEFQELALAVKTLFG